MTHRARLARSDRSRVIQGKIEITISTACFLVCFPRACARAMGRRLQSALHIHATHPSSRSTRCALRPWCAMQRRHGRIRSSTCNNAIVRTAGNNWAIYESGGLALRMYDYCGKRCVARTPWTVRDAPRGPVVPPHTPIARNYSRSHCISISRLDRENHSGNPPRGHRIRRIAEAPWRWCPRLSLSLSLSLSLPPALLPRAFANWRDRAVEVKASEVKASGISAWRKRKKTEAWILFLSTIAISSAHAFVR